MAAAARDASNGFAGAGCATRSRRVVARPLCRRQRLRRVLVDNLCPLEHLRTRVRSHMRAPPGSRRGGEQAHSLRQRERNRATLYVTGFAVRAHTPTAIACARGRKNDGQGAACRSPHGQELGHWCVRAPRRATPSWLQLVCRSGARARSPAITSTRPRAEYSLSKPGRPPASSLHLCAASRTETAATVPATAPSTNKKVMPAPVSPLLPSLLFFFWQVLRNLLSSSSSIYSQPIRLTFFSLEKEGKKKYK